ncbi:MAG: hypothetical protein JRH18_23970 [Deltaproteobacteria bacterium]|nr:hypothetical protein [Deltaproteobacteria bacterium]MBW2154705.1 hypothetical protein [Deltaproteobacteria bacterium]
MDHSPSIKSVDFDCRRNKKKIDKPQNDSKKRLLLGFGAAGTAFEILLCVGAKVIKLSDFQIGIFAVSMLVIIMLILITWEPKSEEYFLKVKNLLPWQK